MDIGREMLIEVMKYFLQANAQKSCDACNLFL